MKRILVNRSYFVTKLALCILLFSGVNGYPTSRPEKSIESEEKQYPNGTVIGKYGYLDKEGNPVQVKYYADDSSYGVELNSVRVLHTKDASASSRTEKQAKKIDEAITNNSSKDGSPDAFSKDGSFDFVDTIKYPAPESMANKYNAPNSEYLEYVNKPGLNTKNAHIKGKYKNPDYEIYAKDDDDGADQQCGANKQVRVYNFISGVTKAQEVPVDVDESQLCEF